MNRRSLLATSAMLASGAALVACSLTTTQIATVSAQVVSDAKLLGNGLTALIGAFGSLNVIPANVVTTIDSDLSQALTAASSVSSAMTQAVAGTVINQVAAGFSAALTVISSYQLPSSMQTIIAAIQTLLPLVEAAVGLLTAPKLASTGMTPTQARAILGAL